MRTNTVSLDRLCTLFVLSTLLLVFEHMHPVLSSKLVLCCTMVTTKHCCYGPCRSRPYFYVFRHRSDEKRIFNPIFKPLLGSSQSRTMGECLQQTGRLYRWRIHRSTTENFCLDEIRPRDWLNVTRPLLLRQQK